MTASHFLDAIQGLLRRDPFEPFTLALVNRERLLVERPDMLTISACGFVRWRDGEDEQCWFDHDSVVAVVLEAPWERPRSKNF